MSTELTILNNVIMILAGIIFRVIYEKLFYGYGEISLLENPNCKDPGDYPYLLKIAADLDDVKKRRNCIFRIRK